MQKDGRCSELSLSSFLLKDGIHAKPKTLLDSFLCLTALKTINPVPDLPVKP